VSEPATDEPPATPAASPPIIAYETPAPSNLPAVLSVVFGVLVFIPFLGILTILLASRGLAAAREGAGRPRLARAGMILGIINLVLTAIWLATLPLAYIRAQRAAEQVRCLSNLRTIAQAEMIYASQNRGYLPPSFDVLVASMPTTPPVTLTRTLGCPACAGNPAKPPATVGTRMRSNYVFLLWGARLTQVRKPTRTVLAYEPLTNHDGRGGAFLFVDGHVELLKPALATKVIAELQAGQNPPPSIP
jgi:prepilin-type processing-associated H-X9-DG protein